MADMGRRDWKKPGLVVKSWNEMFVQKQRQRVSMCLAVTARWTGSDRMERSVYGSFKNAQHGILMLMESAGGKLSLVWSYLAPLKGLFL